MRKPNRLIEEKSPYLRQHAYNPVDWFPWCEEAFEKARREDKPIFLSIGYSTCHWCHVMEKESFEDEEVAEILNTYYVPIKVDREERPDIDAVYMSVCQMMTGSGGWPLTVIMTPDKKPFFAGTYFPKESRFGRPGLKDILLRIAQIWRENREKVLETADKVVQVLEEEGGPSPGDVGEDLIHRAFGDLFGTYDTSYGGFGSAPKFPVPHNLMFLMRYFRRTGNDEAIKMVRNTLIRMRMGGIWDHVGFGFHRYSTDREWKLPHFEKMLYDNALLIYTYSEAFQITGEEIFGKTVEEIATYLTRDMLSEEGGFYSAEDADSEGEEGRFYTWTMDELREVLTEEEMRVAKEVFSLEEEGNYLEEATRRRTGRNVLYMRKTLSEYAADLGYGKEDLEKILERIREKLLKARERRERPLKDDKILADWNGLAIAGFSKAGVVLGRKDLVDIAKRCADFVLSKMVRDDRVLHRYKEGTAEIPGFLEDYAYLIWGLTELYFATFEGGYLKKALELTEHLFKHFWDERGGFYKTPDYGENVLVRRREIYDGALPSGNGIMAYNLVRIGRLTGREELVRRSEDILRSFGDELRLVPSAYTFSIMALDLLINGTFELVAVPGSRADTVEGLLGLERNFLPEGVFLLKDETAEEIAPYTKDMVSTGETTFYLCRNNACERPTTDLGEVLERIRT